MKSIPVILLLDIDGVLIQPGGYRAAVKAAIDHFAAEMGLAGLAPGEPVFTCCESQGITNEWDMVPIFLGAILESVLEQSPSLVLPSNWKDAAQAIRHIRSGLGTVDYIYTVDCVGKLLHPGSSPSLAILEYGLSRAGDRPFKRLAQQPIFEALFRNNKDVDLSLTTGLFQNYVLGNEAFEQTYHKPPLVTTPSFLAEYDRPLLSIDCRDQVQFYARQGKLAPVAYTARPSLPTRGSLTAAKGCSPEAEMAMDLLGMAALPLIAYGRLQAVAQKTVLSTDLLIKPSPFQALAAILAALLLDENKALDLAVQICAESGLFVLPNPEDWPGSRVKADVVEMLDSLRGQSIRVHVIEDSPIGIQAGREACELLAGLGVAVDFQGWGVARDPGKKDALEKQAATVYEHTDEAVQAVLSSLRD